jgi:hypothetical protein
MLGIRQRGNRRDKEENLERFSQLPAFTVMG